MTDLFHTRIGPALSQGSTWAGIAAAITAAAVMPSPWCWLVAGAGVVAVVLKG